MAPKPQTLTRTTRNLPPLSLRASVSPATLDEDKRTVDVVWTTGERVLRGFFERYYEELDVSPKAVRMGRLQGGAPLLDSHNGYNLDGVIGVVDGARVGKGEGTATIRFARDEAGAAIFAKVKDGIIRNVSVGYRVHRLEKVEDGEDKIPVYRATDWEPYELSLVPMGADSGAGVRAETTATNPCEFVQERKMPNKKNPKGTPPDVENPTRAKKADDGDTSDEEDEPDDVEEEEDGDDKTKGKKALEVVDDEEVKLADERKRTLAIRRIGRTLGAADDIVDGAIEKGITVKDFKARAYDDFEKRKHIEAGGGHEGTRIVAGEADRDKWLRGAAAWLYQKAAVTDIVAEAAKKKDEKIDLDAGEFRGMSLLRLAEEALTRAGVRTRGMSKLELVAKAFTFTRDVGGMASTGDFPILLENVLYKTLLSAYATVADTWSKFCTTGTVADFRSSNRYRLGTFGALDSLNEHGEFKNKAIPDGEKQTIAATTKGNIIGITRQAIINDDMGAFNSLATALGRAAKLSIEKDVYALLALNAGLGPLMFDGLTLFHATHKNIGVGAALSVASVDADRVLMGSQTDPSGNEILELRPSILLIALGLGGAARVINNSQYDVDPVTTNATNFFQKPNKVVGLYEMVVDTARLGTSTRRYSFASPQIAPTIEVAFLDGQQEPFLESQLGWRMDGIEWKVREDYGVAPVDFRGATTNAGV